MTGISSHAGLFRYVRQQGGVRRLAAVCELDSYIYGGKNKISNLLILFYLFFIYFLFIYAFAEILLFLY